MLSADTSSKLPQRRDVAALFIREMGGVEQLCRSLFEDYKASIPGSPQRMRIMEYIMEAFAQTERAPTEDLTEAELIAAIEGLSEELDGDAAAR